MIYNLPTEVTVNGNVYHITKKCDYRVVLDVIDAYNDVELDEKTKAVTALLIFFEELTRENISKCDCLNELLEQMTDIINVGEKPSATAENRPRLMDWAHDFNLLAPPINRVLGYSVRSEQYTHWWDFVGAYMEIGDCTFATVVSIRSKRAKGIKLDKSDMEFYREHRDWVDLPQTFTAEEKYLLEGNL